MNPFRTTPPTDRSPLTVRCAPAAALACLALAAPHAIAQTAVTVGGPVAESPAGALGRFTTGAGIGNLPGSTGTVTVDPGGSIRVDYFRPDTTVANLPFVTVGEGPTGTGTLNVAGGSVRLAGDTGVHNVGRSGGTGTLSITNGGTVSGDTTSNGLAFAVIGREGTGTLTVSGAGSQLTISGVGGVNTQGLTGFGGTLQIGRSGAGLGAAGGDGTATVSSGGRIAIGDGGTASPLSGGLAVGFGSNTTGRLTIDGAGSQVDVTGSSGSGTTFVGIGTVRAGTSSPGAGTGVLTVRNGGQLDVSAPLDARIEVGTGRDAAGVRANGTLVAESGASLSANRLAVGGAGGTGTATLDAASLRLRGAGLDAVATVVGPTLLAGTGGGTGTIELRNGASVTFEAGTPISAILVGGSPGAPGGNGTLNVSGGSSIVFDPAATGGVVGIGATDFGLGRMTVTGASTVDLAADGNVVVAATAASAGRLILDGASRFDAGAFFGLCHDGVASTGGLGGAQVTGGSTLSASTIRIGAGCSLGGSGSLVGSTIINGGFVNAGDSPGRMVFDGGFDFISGRIVLEVASNGLGGWLTDTLVFTTPSLVDLRGLAIEFAFLGDANPNLFRASDLWNLDTFFRRTSATGDLAFADRASFDTLFAGSTYDATSERFVIDAFAFDPVRGVTTLAVVPTPGTLALFGVALAAAFGASRRDVWRTARSAG